MENMRFSNYPYVEKIFQCIQKKLGRTSINAKKEVNLEAQREKKVHFCLLMDICYLKKAELEPKFQKHKGREVLLDDMVKDDSGSDAVFTEQVSSASQMTAAKAMVIIARQLNCAGQAAYAVSAYTQVPNGWRAQTAKKNTKVRVSRFWDPSSTTQVGKLMDKHRRSRGSSGTKLKDNLKKFY